MTARDPHGSSARVLRSKPRSLPRTSFTNCAPASELIVVENFFEESKAKVGN